MVFDSNDSIPLQFFWLKRNREKYIFFHKSQFAVSMVELERFEIKYAPRGFHVYKDIWKPKLSQLLEVFHEQGNVYDPFAMAFKAKSAAMLTKSVIGHIPREISRFCRYFMDYGGLLEAPVRDTVCRISPIPNKRLEIPVTLIVKKGCSTKSEVFWKMKHFFIVCTTHIPHFLLVGEYSQVPYNRGGWNSRGAWKL